MNLYHQIRELVPKLPGWCSPEKAAMLALTVLEMRPKLTVEIGVFGGRSLLPLALAHQRIGQGICWGIDPWMAVHSEKGQVKPADFQFWSNCDHESIYREFISHIGPLGVQNFLKIIRAPSSDVKPPAQIDLLHIDGNHGEQAAADAQRFGANVRRGGYCFLDDLDWAGGGVRKAETILRELGFAALYPLDSGAMYGRQ